MLNNILGFLFSGMNRRERIILLHVSVAEVYQITYPKLFLSDQY